VVVCSELPNNPGGSITNSAEQLAAEVIGSHKLPTPLVWIEHWPKEAIDGEEETVELVVFSSYKVEERAPYLGRRGHGWGRYLEAAGPHPRGSLVGRESVGQAIQLTHQGFSPPQPPPHESQSAKLSELRFRALISEGSAERFEQARA
jgi:hypothetical protein